jgi:ribosomal-protein-alanine N-acetyltransferase
MTPPTLTTDRLVLRPVTDADTDAIYEACSNPRVTAYTLFDTHASRDVSAAFVRTYALSNYAGGQLDPLGIALRESPDRLIGCTGLAAGDAPHVREFGYWLAEPFWGRGLVTEAAAAVVRLAFTLPGVERLQAKVIVGNPASGRVLEKCGLRYEGTMRSALLRRGNFEDVMVYAILRPDFLAADERR